MLCLADHIELDAMKSYLYCLTLLDYSLLCLSSSPFGSWMRDWWSTTNRFNPYLHTRGHQLICSSRIWSWSPFIHITLASTAADTSSGLIRVAWEPPGAGQTVFWFEVAYVHFVMPVPSWSIATDFADEPQQIYLFSLLNKASVNILFRMQRFNWRCTYVRTIWDYCTIVTIDHRVHLLRLPWKCLPCPEVFLLPFQRHSASSYLILYLTPLSDHPGARSGQHCKMKQSWWRFIKIAVC